MARSRTLLLVAYLAVSSLWNQTPRSHAQEEAGRVHFLLAVDTIDRFYKALGLDLDGKNIEDTIRWAMGKQNIPADRYTIKVLSGTQMTEKAVLDFYRRLKIGPNDSLVFYYTGHGGFYPDKGHLLNMRAFFRGQEGYKRADIDRAELVAAMARHQPRSIIVLTDCCASSNLPIVAGGVRRKIPDVKNKPPLNENGDGSVFRDLFFRSRGVVNITSSLTGTPSRGERAKGGSFFTLALYKLLKDQRSRFDKDGDGKVTWPEFFPELEKHTELESFLVRKLPDGRLIADFHTPEAFLLGDSIRPEIVANPKTKNPVLAVDADLTDKDMQLNRGGGIHYAREFQIDCDASHAYLVNLHSSHFDTMIFVKDPTGKIVADNDDYGTTTTRSRVLFFPPAAGKYTVQITSYGTKETGRFSLTVQQSTFVGELRAGDPRDRYCIGAYSKMHPIKLTAHRSYTIQLESLDTRKLDPFLRVEDRYGNTVALNDDEDQGQERLNSVISFRTVASDTYYVVATTFAPGQTGKYAIFIQE